jgi:hypothetical protein
MVGKGYRSEDDWMEPIREVKHWLFRPEWGGFLLPRNPFPSNTGRVAISFLFS